MTTNPVVQMTEEQTRMLALGFLTGAANALTMGGNADDFAYQRTQMALGMIAPKPVLVLTYEDIDRLLAGEEAAMATVRLMMGR